MNQVVAYSEKSQAVQSFQSSRPELLQKSLIKDGKYREALAVYGSLAAPSAEATRLAGHSEWGLGNYLQATIYLSRASNQGEYGALVDILRLQVVQNQFDDIESKIANVDPEILSDLDKIQLKILKGEMAVKKNKLSIAKRFFLDAWISTNTYHDCGSLKQVVARNLFVVCHATAVDSEAISYLDQALASANGIWLPYLQLSKAQANLMLGDFSSFKIDKSEIPEIYRGNLLLSTNYVMTQSLYDFLNNNTQSAVSKLQTTLQQLKVANSNTSSITRVQYYLVAMHIQQKHFDQARGQLVQLEVHAQNRGEIAMFHHRKGQYLAAQGLLSDALVELETARETLFDLEWRKELGWTLLQLAHVHLNLGNPQKAVLLLESITDIINIVGNAAFLELERKFIGDLKPLIAIASSYGLHALHHQLPLNQPILSRPTINTISFHSFGITTLSLNGQPVSCKLNRAFAVMAYLLMYPQSSLEKILTDVFDDSKDVVAAKNYFHTSRYELHRAFPCIRFAYDRITKTYSVDTGEVPIQFDYQEAIRLLHAPSENEFYDALKICRGPFMPGYEAQWIEEVRANVEWLLVRSGLKLVQEMYESGDFQACRRLTERLLKVEPLDESLNELLVRATREVEGALASRKAMSMVESQFLQEVGELPPTLAQLKSEMKFRIN
jgi:DNA-binding SARP family transcriptional activator